jgi:AraC family transcriptional regulator
VSSTAASLPAACRLVYGPALTLAVQVARYTRETVGGIPGQWARFGALVPYLPGRTGPATFGLCYEWIDGALDYGCAVEVVPGRALPDGWSLRTIPTVRYAMFPFDGHLSELPGLEARLLGEWLPASGHVRLRELAGGKLRFLERYGPRFDPRAGRGDVELWLPVEG